MASSIGADADPCSATPPRTPVAAKGDPIAPLQRMLRTGLGQLRTESLVTEIVLDRTGQRATGVYTTPPRSTDPGSASSNAAAIRVTPSSP